MREEKVVLTNMCMIINENNEVVVQRRKKNWTGCAFPGGHIENQESVILSTIREVKEETNLDVSNLISCGIKQWFKEDVRYICFLFKTFNYTGELSSDTEENFWYKIEDLNKLDLSFSFDEMLKLFLNDGYNELYHKKEKDVIKYIFR